MRPSRLFLAGVLAVALAFPATVEARHREFNPIGAFFGGIFGYHRYYHHRHFARRHEEEPTADSQDTRRGRHHRITQSHGQAAPQEAATDEQQPTGASPDTRRGRHRKIAQPQEQSTPQEAAVEDQQPEEDSPETRRGRHQGIAQPNEQPAPQEAATEVQQSPEQLQLTMQAPPPASLSSLPAADFASIDDDFFGYVFAPSSYDAKLWAHGERDMILTVFNKGSTSAPNCGDQGTKRAAPLIERVEQATRPNEEQQAALRELQAALSKAFDEIRTTCRDVAPITPTARLKAMQERLFAIRDAGLSIRIALGKFYDLLTNEQRALFDTTDPTASTNQKQNNGTQRSAAQVCTAQIQAPNAWPAALIGRRVRPNEQQRASLQALQKTLFGMAMYLKGACPSEAQSTPIARLDAAMHRLDGMLYAVIAISPALDDFYGQLSDEQKARFNAIDRTST
jgi:hypothetical protein